MDIQLFFDEKFFIGDIGLDSNSLSRDLAIDTTLKTAVLISLFTDRRAIIDDKQERGWWADSYNELGSNADEIGSKLWLLSREKVTPLVLVRAKEYAIEALQWLKEDGLVKDFSINVASSQKDSFVIKVKLHINELLTESFSHTFGGQNGLV